MASQERQADSLRLGKRHTVWAGGVQGCVMLEGVLRVVVLDQYWGCIALDRVEVKTSENVLRAGWGGTGSQERCKQFSWVGTILVLRKNLSWIDAELNTTGAAASGVRGRGKGEGGPYHFYIPLNSLREEDTRGQRRNKSSATDDFEARHIAALAGDARDGEVRDPSAPALRVGQWTASLDIAWSVCARCAVTSLSVTTLDCRLVNSTIQQYNKANVEAFVTGHTHFLGNSTPLEAISSTSLAITIVDRTYLAFPWKQHTARGNFQYEKDISMQSSVSSPRVQSCDRSWPALIARLFHRMFLPPTIAVLDKIKFSKHNNFIPGTGGGGRTRLVSSQALVNISEKRWPFHHVLTARGRLYIAYLKFKVVPENDTRLWLIRGCNTQNLLVAGASVAERLARSPLTKANRVQSPAGSPDFRKWKSCRTLVGGFSRASPVSPNSFIPAPLHIHLKHPLRLPRPRWVHPPENVSAFDVEKLKGDKDDNITRVKCAIVTMRRASDWRVSVLVLRVPRGLSATTLSLQWSNIGIYLSFVHFRVKAVHDKPLVCFKIQQSEKKPLFNDVGGLQNNVYSMCDALKVPFRPRLGYVSFAHVNILWTRDDDDTKEDKKRRKGGGCIKKASCQLNRNIARHVRRITGVTWRASCGSWSGPASLGQTCCEVRCRLVERRYHLALWARYTRTTFPYLPRYSATTPIRRCVTLFPPPPKEQLPHGTLTATERTNVLLYFHASGYRHRREARLGLLDSYQTPPLQHCQPNPRCKLDNGREWHSHSWRLQLAQASLQPRRSEFDSHRILVRVGKHASVTNGRLAISGCFHVTALLRSADSIPPHPSTPSIFQVGRKLYIDSLSLKAGFRYIVDSRQLRPFLKPCQISTFGMFQKHEYEKHAVSLHVTRHRHIGNAFHTTSANLVDLWYDLPEKEKKERQRERERHALHRLLNLYWKNSLLRRKEMHKFSAQQRKKWLNRTASLWLQTGVNSEMISRPVVLQNAFCQFSEQQSITYTPESFTAADIQKQCKEESEDSRLLPDKIKEDGDNMKAGEKINTSVGLMTCIHPSITRLRNCYEDLYFTDTELLSLHNLYWAHGTYARLHHRGSKLDPRSDLRSTQKTVAPFEFRAGLEIEMKFISNHRNRQFEILIRDQQPSEKYAYFHDVIYYEPIAKSVSYLISIFLFGTMIDESEIDNHEISLAQHFYIGTKIKLYSGSELGSFDLGSGKMLVQPGISAPCALDSEQPLEKLELVRSGSLIWDDVTNADKNKHGGPGARPQTMAGQGDYGHRAATL
ncbi:hypothetical protein PR048_006364 [Dryococelus australis]|uniref:Uncharacterized protein n=1 Tax=Dryococelus australis TaxID=614101 RepID=A0ABQ9IAS5_9NEOP|nr:hypothetical protein PR048_006364 [Dryococelus australis]